jgi:TonB-linked SusC/RagA family outer membrane protein
MVLSVILMLLTAIPALAQERTVTGTVKDGEGEVLVGATVVEKGKRGGALTDVNGRFSLTVAANAELQVSYLGFATKTVAVGNRADIEIVLSEDIQRMDEVVVVGYGVQKKRDLTGAISSVKVAEMPVQTYSTISHALAGKAAGLRVTQTSAQPGGAAKFRIRGETSTGAGNDPLIIIDGFPVSQVENLGSGNRYSGGESDNILESINPGDIESIEVLKDASATAIYGSRAGHGVIIVTTKRGKNQRANVSYSGNMSIQQTKANYRMLSTQDYMLARDRIRYERYLQENWLDVYSEYSPRKLDPNRVITPFVPMYSAEDIANASGTNWLDEITRTGFQQSHNISVTGGSEAIQVMASVNYFNQEGIIKSNGMDRFTSRFNMDYRLSRFVKTGLTFSLSRNRYDNVPLGTGDADGSGIIASAMQFNPTLPIYDELGDYTIDPFRSTVPNPVSLLEIADESQKDRLLSTAFLEVEPVKGVLLKASLGADRRNAKRKTYLPRTTLYGKNTNGSANIIESNNIDYLMDLTATWAKEIGQHNFTLLAGYSWQGFNYEIFAAGNSEFMLDSFLYNNLGLGANERPSVGSGASESALGSYFARLNYSFLGRYLLTATMRADGASNFNPEYRWGYFPSASLAWRFSDEAFMQPFSSWLSNGKLRIGYGETGNSNVGNRTINTYNAGTTSDGFGTIFGDTYQVGILANRLGNPKLRWETTSELNIGLEVGFLGGRISAEMEYYQRTISDLLRDNKKLPSYNEITSIAANIGKTRGRGFELTINTVNMTGRDFEWSTGLTYSFYRDNWLERDPEWTPEVYESATDPLRPVFSTLADGILQVGETPPAAQPNLLPGQVKVKDLSGPNGVPDGYIDSYDMVYFGSQVPDFFFGINNTVRYKNFDLNIYFYGDVNRLDQSGSYYEIGADNIVTTGINVSERVKEMWYHNNQDSKYHNPVNLTPYGGAGDYYQKKISFIRCRNITLGYILPLPKTLVQRARVYVDVNNPFIITNWTGLDPETDIGMSTGQEQANNFAYPNIMSFTLGVDITF